MHLWAQASDDADDDDAGPDGSFATLTLRYDPRGTAEVNFLSLGGVKNWSDVEGALERIMHCSSGSLVHPPAKPELPRFFRSRSEGTGTVSEV